MCLAIPGLIMTVEGADLQREGIVQFGQVERQVNLALTPEAVPGNYVLVHVGCAISILDEEEAGRVFAVLEDMEVLSR